MKLEVRFEIKTPYESLVAESSEAAWTRVRVISVCWASVHNGVEVDAIGTCFKCVEEEFQVLMADLIDCDLLLLLGSLHQETDSAEEMVNKGNDLSDVNPSANIRFELTVRHPSSF